MGVFGTARGMTCGGQARTSFVGAEQANTSAPAWPSLRPPTSRNPHGRTHTKISVAR